MKLMKLLRFALFPLIIGSSLQAGYLIEVQQKPWKINIFTEEDHPQKSILEAGSLEEGIVLTGRMISFHMNRFAFDLTFLPLFYLMSDKESRERIKKYENQTHHFRKTLLKTGLIMGGVLMVKWVRSLQKSLASGLIH
jgi:hypothetical protein